MDTELLPGGWKSSQRTRHTFVMEGVLIDLFVAVHKDDGVSHGVANNSDR